MDHNFILLALLAITVSCQSVAVRNFKNVNHLADETLTCNTTSPVNLSPGNQSLVFIVHDSVTTNVMINEMQKEMEKTIYDIKNQHPETKLTLIVFNNFSMHQPIDTYDSNVFLESFKQFAYRNYYNTTVKSCKDLPVLEAIYIYLSAYEGSRNSNIYFFMDGIMRYDNDALFSHVKNLIVETQSKVSFVQTSVWPCGESITTEGPLFMWNISSISGGEVFVLSRYLVRSLMSTFVDQFKSSQIVEVTFNDCTNEIIFPFSLDSQTHAVNILIDGGLSVTQYIDPDGNTNNAAVTNAYADYGSSSRLDQILESSNSSIKPGYWAVKLKSSEGSCSVRITTQSNIFVNYSFVQDEHDDIGTLAPISGTNNYLIAHVNGLMPSDPAKSGILKSATLSSNGSSLHLEMRLRDSKTCKHEYISYAFGISPDVFKTFKLTKLTFNGVDPDGYDFQRVHMVVN